MHCKEKKTQVARIQNIFTRKESKSQREENSELKQEQEFSFYILTRNKKKIKKVEIYLNLKNPNYFPTK